MSEPRVLDKMIWVVTDNPEKAQLIRTLLAYEDREILRSFKDLQFETLSSAAEARERLHHIHPKIIVQFAQVRGDPAGNVYYANREDYIPGGSGYSYNGTTDLIVISKPWEFDGSYRSGECDPVFIEPLSTEQQSTVSDLMKSDFMKIEPSGLAPSPFQKVVHSSLTFKQSQTH